MEQYIYIIPVSQIPVILTSECSCVMSQLRLESQPLPSPSLPPPSPSQLTSVLCKHQTSQDSPQREEAY